MRSKEEILKNTFIDDQHDEYCFSRKECLSAMHEFAKEVAIEFKKWKDDKYWSDYFHDDGHTPLDNAPLWSSDSVRPEMLTTEQLFNQFLQEIKQDK